LVTSRTGTATYLRARRNVLAKAKRTGLTHCPGYTRHDGSTRTCERELNYDIPLLDESAETDHIIEYKHGGTDNENNLRVLCRHCNRERNNTRTRVPVPQIDDFPTSQAW
jgi:5-methylcytosine-specific restriction endonuclease McrA